LQFGTKGIEGFPIVVLQLLLNAGMVFFLFSQTLVNKALSFALDGCSELLSIGGLSPIRRIRDLVG